MIDEIYFDDFCINLLAMLGAITTVMHSDFTLGLLICTFTVEFY
jgi:hypothetical protein